MSYKKEFERMKLYAKGLGIKVTLLKREGDDYSTSEWLTTGDEIIFYNIEKKKFLDLIIDFIHELSHHMFWVHNGRKGDLKTDRALDKNQAYLESGETLPKKYRKIIYQMEKDEAVYQEVIHKEIGSKVPLWRVRSSRDLDIWIYRKWYQTGEWSRPKAIDEQFKKLRKKYENRK